jgi:hypothetical protein
VKDGIHVDMDRLKKGEVKYVMFGHLMRDMLTSDQPWYFDVSLEFELVDGYMSRLTLF